MPKIQFTILHEHKTKHKDLRQRSTPNHKQSERRTQPLQEKHQQCIVQTLKWTFEVHSMKNITNFKLAIKPLEAQHVNNASSYFT